MLVLKSVDLCAKAQIYKGKGFLSYWNPESNCAQYPKVVGGLSAVSKW